MNNETREILDKCRDEFKIAIDKRRNNPVAQAEFEGKIRAINSRVAIWYSRIEKGMARTCEQSRHQTYIG